MAARMSQLVRHSAGLWWKFDRYDLKDGYIVPAKNARLTRYNPWNDYWDARDARTRDQQQPAYSSLLQLLTEIKTLPASDTGRLEPNRDSRHAILEWCAQYGLLGLLHHVTQAVYLPGRTVKGQAAPVYGEYLRESTGWRSRFHTAGRHIETAGNWDAVWDPFSRGTAVDGDLGTVICSPFGSLTAATSTIEEEWASFFPSVPIDQRRTYPYPPPYSTPFWKLYGEPLDLFLRMAGLLRETVDAFNHPEGISIAAIDVVPPPDGGVPHARKDRRSDSALQRLHLLTSPVRMSLGSYKRGAQVVWCAASLLSAFGAMLCEDLADNRHHRCEECQRVFISNQPTVRFCSKKCLNTATKRTYRHRKQARARGKVRVN